MKMHQELSAAAAAADWSALVAANLKLAREIPSLAARGAWSEAERAALLTLRNTHAETMQVCNQEKERLGSHLSTMQAHKEGWLAYALAGDADRDGNLV